MTDSPLHVAFLWHMHQPYYKDPLTGLFRLPWVRLHGTKDYLDMVEILEDFPEIRQNFNLVPSLLEQLIDYADHGGSDVYLEVSRKKAADLTLTEKVFILESFFLANWERMIRPFPRYFELLQRRGTHFIRSELPRIANYFTASDFLDLQVFFNLCWVDPVFRDRDPFLRSLVEKGGNYTEAEKAQLLDVQLQIIRRIIPAYRKLASRGQIELSFTPFYHPILPLLCDTDIARVAMPNVVLPRHRFTHPEDAERQIAMGIEFFENVFGSRPAGMWPSEGSVSEEVLKAVSRQGIRWVATDEAVLAHSLRRGLRDGSGNLTDPQALYRPYEFGGVSVVFRDHTLSDLLGFVYSQWDPFRAAEDLVQRLVHIKHSLPAGRPGLVSIILDGENAWEHFQNDGRDFFLHLYGLLSRERRLKTVTVSEFLERYGAGERLAHLHPGSWINANYGIWIGHEEDNLAWDYLTDARERLEHYQRENSGMSLEKAWKAVYIAEGSDWNWWYGDEHTTETQEDFDELFRRNLMQVYREMGKEPPPHLSIPVLRYDRSIAPTLTIRGFIRPRIDGLVTSYYEWYQGAQLDVRKSGGSMHRSEGLVSAIWFGFNQESLFLRLDPTVPFVDFDDDIELWIMTLQPAEMKVVCPVTGVTPSAALFEKQGDAWQPVPGNAEVGIQDIFEIAIPFSDLKAGENNEIHLYFSIRRQSDEIERCPWRGHITITVPSPHFEAMMWY